MTFSSTVHFVTAQKKKGLSDLNLLKKHKLIVNWGYVHAFKDILQN